MRRLVDYRRSCNDWIHQIDVSIRIVSAHSVVEAGTFMMDRHNVTGMRDTLRLWWYRLRGWLVFVAGCVSIAAMLAGFYGLYALVSSPAFDKWDGNARRLEIVALETPVSVAGWPVPSVGGLTPMQTLLAGSVLVLVSGLAVSIRLFTGSFSPGMHSEY